MGIILRKVGDKWRALDSATKVIVIAEDGSYLDKGGYYQKAFAQKQLGLGWQGAHNPKMIK